MKTIAVIPARGGSKRIPRKNIKDFLGQPIIKYSIDTALAAGCFDIVMVSTDCPEIAAVAKAHGAQVPFLRSAATADDHTPTGEVLKEVVAEYKKRRQNFDHLCCLLPTAPFVTAERLKKAMALLAESDADCVLPVTRFGYPIQRGLRIIDGHLKMFWPENYYTRSQDLEPAYHDCGQFFCTKVPSLLQDKINYSGVVIPIEVPAHEVQDIDNPEDWQIAEMKYKFLKDLS